MCAKQVTLPYVMCKSFATIVHNLELLGLVNRFIVLEMSLSITAMPIAVYWW